MTKETLSKDVLDVKVTGDQALVKKNKQVFDPAFRTQAS